MRAAPAVKVRVVGLDKNRKDLFVKFNAEVSTSGVCCLPGRRADSVLTPALLHLAFAVQPAYIPQLCM